MTVKGGTGQACAACKFQRRKCASDCQLAPYFPADQQSKFHNAHRLFGVRNMLNILNKLDDPLEKAEAMKSIVYEADTRHRFPVHGCVTIVWELWYKIFCTKRELDVAMNQILYLRQHHQHQFSASPPSSSSHLQLGMQPLSNNSSSGSNSSSNDNNNQCNVLPLFKDEIVGIADGNDDSCVKEMSLSWAAQQQQLQQQNFFMNEGNGNYFYQNPFVLSNSAGVEALQECDEISPYLDATDMEDRQLNYIVDSKEAYESTSPESSLRDTVYSGSVEDIPTNELKTAAARFSLTSTY